jgi:hypothetical protein
VLVVLAAIVLGVFIAVKFAGTERLAPLQKYARRINLKAGDVPGMRIGSGEEGQEAKGDYPGPSAPRYRACAHSPVHTFPIVSRRSPAFEGAGANLASHVEIWPTAAVAAQAAAVDQSPLGRVCAAQMLNGVQGHFSFSDATASLQPSPLPGAFWLRIQTAATEVRGNSRGQPRPVYFDSLGFLSARAEIVLTVTASQRPMPPAAEVRVLSLLYERSARDQPPSG